MTESEINQAIAALKQWFMSQDIDPGDAGIMMIKLQAEMFTHKTKDLLKLQEAMKSTSTLLAIEIVGYLRT